MSHDAYVLWLNLVILPAVWAVMFGFMLLTLGHNRSVDRHDIIMTDPHTSVYSRRLADSDPKAVMTEQTAVWSRWPLTRFWRLSA